jgi:hypothetical protein
MSDTFSNLDFSPEVNHEPFAFPGASRISAENSTQSIFGSTSTSSPVSANHAQIPFSQTMFGTTTTQPLPAFGIGVFEQTNILVSSTLLVYLSFIRFFQSTTTNLFQKPAQTTTGFNTEQPGFSWYDGWPGTTEALNLVQNSKVKNKTIVFYLKWKVLTHVF